MENDLRFDFTNVTNQVAGDHGISDNQLATMKDKAEAIDADLKARHKGGKLPFMNLPNQNVDDIVSYADEAKGTYENFVNVGIGGSALGAQACFMALCHPFHNQLERRPNNGMRMFFADNIDPDYLYGIFDACEPSKTLYNVITKSGSTAETMGTFLLVKEALETSIGSKWRDHVVVTTDKEKGDLRTIAGDEELKAYVVPDGVGGRFSVLTPVGLLPAACAGINIRQLLSGAGSMAKRLDGVPVMDNPAYLYAMYQYLLDTAKSKPMSVMMPYSSGLYGLADWYRQLWAESLGKKYDLGGNVVNVGPTPIKALGVTDQHSQVQLYAEGPNDKVFTFLAVEQFARTMPMKAAYPEKSSLEYLGGRNMGELIDAERTGTVYALTKQQRPNLTITFPMVNPNAVGQFFHAMEVATVFSGGLYNIDPLDQPGVEAGKIAAYALMGRSGYEDRADEIRAGVSSNPDYVK